VLSGVAPLVAAAGLIGNIGLLIAAVRTLNALFVPFVGDPQLVDRSGGILSRDGVLVSERLLEWIVYGSLVLLVNLFSFFPQIYLPWIEKLLLMFERIGR
jgi:hypothetical protein